jgi:hypothetical protein
MVQRNEIAGLLIAVALGATIAGCGKNERPWREFSSPECKFKVLLPDDPVQDVKRSKLETHTFATRTAHSQFTIICLMMDAEGIKAKSPDEWIDIFRDGMLKTKGSKLAGEKPISLKSRNQEYVGREFEVRQAGQKGVGRVYILNDRTLALQMVDLDGKTQPEDVQKFFDSLSVE